ncbi:hypothetical protein QZH41_014599 [Actinostola sp. cb2023]|nr:hypothetical protein QZH41_014599 [Actinostola sp. cb2023]
MFDLVSLFKIGPMTENKWLNRIIMLETVAGVPGMIGGMARHLKSLRKLGRDGGWIHTLLEEAENERLHLMTALELKQPGPMFRAVIIGAQGVFVNMFFVAYMFSPRYCHRFVGYLEEEAVKTYTYCLECIDNGKLPAWKHKKAPDLAITYWSLKVRTLYTSSSCHQHLSHFKQTKDADVTSTKDKESSYAMPHPICRIIMLETVAGVPGMIGGMARHLKSLRKLDRDHGWIHTLLEEAENERMHLMTALELKEPEPGKIFRAVIIGAQGVFVNMFFVAYLFSPRYCHRFVGYLEEEAVKTYTYCLECIDNGKLPAWENKKAPDLAITYWKLKEDATMRDTILAIRADEAHHRVVNHTLSSLHLDEQNPFFPGQRKL